MQKIFVFDPTISDKNSAVRGVGRYLQILKENFSQWNFLNQLKNLENRSKNSIFINPFFNFLQFPLTFKRLAEKQIAVIHDLIPLKYPDKFPAGIRGKLNIFFNKLILKNYEMIITDSYSSKNDIIKILKIPEEKIKVIYPCLTKVFSNKKSTINKPLINNRYCLYIGDATWNKNLINLAKAIKIINITCVFAGKIFDKKIQEKIALKNNKWLSDYQIFLKETADDKRFIFLGYLKDEELINLYKNAVLNILPSYDEGFGFSYIEASSLNCPTLLSDIPVFREIAKNQTKRNNNLSKLLFFDPKNPYDIADKIGAIYFNPKIRKKIIESISGLSEFFSCKKFQDSIKTILKNL